MQIADKIGASVSRRTVLKTVGGAVGSTAIVGTAMSHDGRKRTIVVAERDDEPLVTKQVPTDWYEHVQRSWDASDELLQQFGDEPWFDRISRSSREGNYRIGDHRKKKLKIKTKDAAAARLRVPESHRGLPVEVVEIDNLPERQGCSDWSACNDNTYSCVKGGAYLSLEQPDGSYCSQSAGVVVEYGGGTGLITCYHGFSPYDCSVDIEGLEGLQGNDDLRIGEVDAYDSTQDWAILTEKNAEIDGLDDEIIQKSNPVNGHVTKSGLEDMESRDDNKPIKHYGASTCSNHGYDIELSTTHNCDSDKEVDSVELNDSSSNTGDSGSPMYVHYDEFDVIGIAGILHRGGPIGVAAHAINNKHGIEFGGVSTC
jgi:hypothetical protein